MNVNLNGDDIVAVGVFDNEPLAHERLRKWLTSRWGNRWEFNGNQYVFIPHIGTRNLVAGSVEPFELNKFDIGDGNSAWMFPVSST